MKIKRYAVTVMDNWTPMRTFWTLEGAKKFYREHRTCANVFKWDGEAWGWICGARDQASGPLGYATRLAIALWSKHWKEGLPDWQPLPDLMGVLTQIDNMTSGMKRFEPVCQRDGCRKTPQNIGWCDQCGYNRLYKDESVAVPSGH